MKKIITSVFVVTLFSTISLLAQKPTVIKGGKLCENYLLKTIAQDKSAGNRMVKLQSKEPLPTGVGQSAENSPLVKLAAFKTDNKTLSENLEKWLELENIENLAAYEVQLKGKKALILNSTNIQATGLASNFYYWFIRSNNHSIEFISLSKNPKLVFWDKKGLLNYYVIDLSDEFIDHKDWSRLTINIFRYRVTQSGESQLVNKKQNVRCN